MKLFELFLVETTEEDRAIISLSSEIFKKLRDQYSTGKPQDIKNSENLVSLGKIGDMFDTPIQALNNISIDLQGGKEFTKRTGDTPKKNKIDISTVPAFWEAETDTVVLNSRYLNDPRIRTVITHELRHALDEIKSGSFPASPKNKNPDPNSTPSYFIPKKKKHRRSDVDKTLPYRAQPGEINARFIEVLDVLSNRLPGIVDEYGNNSFDAAVRTVGALFKQYKIADIYPEKEGSKEYKQLMKRAADFITKEINHLKTP
jgi:hypothetical protein